MEDLYRLLRAGDAQAQSIVDTIELPLLVLDQTFQVVNANPAFAGPSGLTATTPSAEACST